MPLFTAPDVVAFEPLAQKTKNLHDVDEIPYRKNRGKYKKQKRHSV
jgi:hypothetical protein